MAENSDPHHVQVFNFLKTPAGWWFIGGVAALVAATAAGAYKIGSDIGRGAADSYDAATKMNFAQLSKEAIAATSDLRKASTDFSELVASSETSRQLKEKNEALSAELTSTKSELESLRAQNSNNIEQLAKAQSEVNRLESVDELVTIKSGAGGEFFAGGNLFISYNYYSRLRVNGKEYDAGEGAIVQVDGRHENAKCTLLIKKIVGFPAEQMNMSIACNRP